MKPSFIELFSGEKAFNLLTDDSFRKQWLYLHEQSEYATIFQHPSYVVTWYKTYRPVCRPVLVVSKYQNDVINGLWFLTYNKASKKLEHAGTNQAEYQVWITIKGYETEFLSESWNLLNLELDFRELHLKYLPENYLLKYLQSSESTKKLVIGKSYERPFFAVNEETIRNLFSAKARRSLAKFEKTGKVKFTRVKTIEEFDAVFDSLIDFYDFRMGALKNVIPFRADQFKREFHRNLFLSDPDNIIFTVTYVDGQPVAGEFSGLSKKTYSFLLLMHEPFLTKYSPGYVHVLQLCVFAKNENINKIDLTPGGDSWKARFSSDYDQVVYAIIYNSRLKKILAELKNSTVDKLKLVLSKLGIKNSTIKNAGSSILRIFKTPKTSIKRQESTLFEYNNESVSVSNQEEKAFEIRLNSIKNLLMYLPEGDTQARCDFLSKTYDLIETGAISYSIAENNCLLANIWVQKNSASVKQNAIELPSDLPAEHIVLSNFYFNTEKLGKTEATGILRKILETIFSSDKNQKVYAIATDENNLAQEAIKSLRFNRITA